jgi:16S rRNA (cytosine967-C5)-methyltransferase
MKSREAAFLALIAWHKKGLFLWDSLQNWKQEENPSLRDLNFSYELACGTVRALGYLEWVAKKHSKSLPKKQTERLLLYLGLYQKLFLQNIPLFAVVDETVELAKKHTSVPFASFLNATLRKEIIHDNEGIVTPLCYPKYYVELLTTTYGKQKAFEILLQGNSPSPLMATRFTESGPINAPCDAIEKDSYIQNCTPFTLVTELAKNLQAPTRILDMCASPGGKTLLLRHLFPQATIVASDLPKKLAILQENLKRFSCEVEVIEAGSKKDDRYDLIVVDAPCSNTGVLYKCPEARWRLSNEATTQLVEKQLMLIAEAKALLTEGGSIWYMTCSILPDENEQVVLRSGLQEKRSILQLPNNEGFDGGFASHLTL